MNPTNEPPDDDPPSFHVETTPNQLKFTTETVRRMQHEIDLYDMLKASFPNEDIDKAWDSITAPLVWEPAASRDPELLAEVQRLDPDSPLWNHVRWILATFDDVLAEENE